MICSPILGNLHICWIGPLTKILNQRGGFEHCSREELMGPHANLQRDGIMLISLVLLRDLYRKTCIIRTLLLKDINYHINIY